MKTKIQFINGKPLINADESLHSPLAYTAYFDECGEWEDFIKCGYKMFFVNVSFTDLPINNVTSFTPFRTGIFENESPDYSEFDEMVRSIVAKCPDCMIFPRINIAMPRKWIRENPYETVATPTGNRESLFSNKFMLDGTELLKKLLAHISQADYTDRIAGYQLCGGTTQEWIHHDLFGSFSEMGMEKFRNWVLKKYGIKNIKIPERDDFESGIVTEETKKYYEFCCEAHTKTIEHFARVTKEFTNNEKIVGVFYGYNAFVPDCLWGLHGLWHIIDSPYIDFFSSPCCYDHNRELGFDWGDMLPVDTLKLHGKLCFVECDIRTHLTKRMQESRPGMYPEDSYQLFDTKGNKTVWCGPETPELSLSAIRKAFAHQITKASGIWWFDMWGGWYHSSDIMADSEKMRLIYEKANTRKTNDLPASEVVLFIDEKAYRNLPRGNGLLNMVNHLRVKMSSSGIPFDTYMVEDAEAVIEKYKVAIFSAPIPSEEGKKAFELCEALNLPYISAEKNAVFYTTEEIRNMLVSFGVHCYNPDGCVVYCGNGILGVHTVADGKNTIKLPKKLRVKALLGEKTNEAETDVITFTANKHSTVLFELKNI